MASTSSLRTSSSSSNWRRNRNTREIRFVAIVWSLSGGLEDGVRVVVGVVFRVLRGIIFLPREWIFGFGLVDRRVYETATTALFVPVFAFVCVCVCVCVYVSLFLSPRERVMSREREREYLRERGRWVDLLRNERRKRKVPLPKGMNA